MGMYPQWLEEGRASAQNALLALWPQQTSTHPSRPSSNVTFPGTKDNNRSHLLSTISIVLWNGNKLTQKLPEVFLLLGTQVP